MRFGSVCSGIEAASVAWSPLGWEAAWLSEIEPFPSAVLKHHYPEVPNYGDMTKLPERILAGDIEAPDLFCGGTPCQAFSVAGLRKSLEDARGNLSLTFCEIANAIDHVRRGRGEPPAVIFWENVPGVLSTKDNAFGCFISALAGCDTAVEPLAATGWTDAGVVAGPQRTVAWRILDAQYFGLAQRRRRVFVVASSREGFDPAAVLLEWEGLRRDSAPSREAGKVAPTIPSRSTAGGGLGTDFDLDGGIVGALYAGCGPNGHGGSGLATLQGAAQGHLQVAQPYAVANCLTQRMHKGINTTLNEGQTPVLQPLAFGVGEQPYLGHCLRSGASKADKHESTTYIAQPVGIFQDSEFGVAQYDSAGTLRAGRIPEHQMVLQPAIAWDEELNASVEQAGTLLRGGQGGRHDGVLAFHPTQDPISSENICHSISSGNGQGCATAAVACEIADTLSVGANQTTGFASDICAPTAMQVRRLTPVECSRLQGFPDDYLELFYADADEAHAAQVLHELWREAGTPAVEEQGWRTRISAALLTPEILLAGVHGGWLSWEMAARCAAARGALSCEATSYKGFVRALRESGEARRSPFRRQSFEQCARELGGNLSILPLESAQAKKALRDSKLWPQAQARWPLRYALAKGKARENLDRMNPDGPRYKALGNSWAVPVVHWIGKRIHSELHK